MYQHIELGEGFSGLRNIRQLIAKGKIAWAGNANLKIYGLLTCRSGKTMKKENRVFFKDEIEAISYGFRPCGHCMKEKYQLWKLSVSERQR
jgi:methylphosphotriester-DNA--protein-cysteine methyltransferase